MKFIESPLTSRVTLSYVIYMFEICGMMVVNFLLLFPSILGTFVLRKANLFDAPTMAAIEIGIIFLMIFMRMRYIVNSLHIVSAILFIITGFALPYLWLLVPRILIIAWEIWVAKDIFILIQARLVEYEAEHPTPDAGPDERDKSDHEQDDDQ